MNSLTMKKDNCIGVFDSGVGGISELKELVQLLPNENYIYYGDSLHAPYGEKTPEQVFELVNRVVRYLLSQDVKAIVIACNTATSVAVSRLREMYPEISIIGMEPALKKAVSTEKRNKVLVMATPVTLHLEKYRQLQRKLEAQADFVSVECPGLAKRIERGDFEAEDLKMMLRGFLEPYRGTVDNVVLGCTHYPFVKKQIHEILGDLPLIDGGKGTSSQVKRLLEEKNLLNDQSNPGSIRFESSMGTEEEIQNYKNLYDLYEV